MFLFRYIKISFLVLFISLLFLSSKVSAVNNTAVNLNLTVYSSSSSSLLVTASFTNLGNQDYYYKLQRKLSSGIFEDVSGFLDSKLYSSFNDSLNSSLQNGIYIYKIAVYSTDSQLLGYSNEASFNADEIVQPSGLKFSDSTANSITISWQYPDQKSVSTMIERKMYGSSDWLLINVTNPGTFIYTDSNVDQISKYDYRIRSMYGVNSFSQYIEIYSGEAVIKKPSTPEAEKISNTSVLIRWENVWNQYVKILIERSVNNSDFEQVYETALNETLWYDYNIDANSTYSYRIRAKIFYNGKLSEYSDVTTVYATNIVAPSYFRATAVANDKISLSWTDNSQDETNFEIWRKNNSTDKWEKYAVVEKNSTSYNDTGVAYNTTYYYKIRAYASYNDSYSIFTIESQATSLIISSEVYLDYEVISLNEIQLIWDYSPSSSESLIYYIEKKYPQTSDWVKIATLDISVKSFVDKSIESNKKYSYRLVLFDSTNNSKKTTQPIEVITGVPTPPTNLNIVSISPINSKLSWKDNSLNEDGFIIYRSANGTEYTEYARTPANSTIFIDKLLLSGIFNHYKVVAYNKTGSSESSNENFIYGNNAKFFSDTSTHPWAELAINQLSNRGIINGKSDTLFYPNDIITRAEFTSMVIRAFNISRTPFGSIKDIRPTDWFYKDILTAKNLGIINTTNNNFYPNSPITREDSAVILSKAISFSGKPITNYSISILDNFNDKDTTSPYAISFLANLFGEGIITGRSDTELSPKGTTTRAEASVLIFRAIE